MSYAGYRLKIEGIILPNEFITRGSYSVNSEAKRVIKKWTDANQIDHVTYAAERRSTITFRLRQHNLTEHLQIAAAVKKRSDINIEYYNDSTGEYSTGIFDCGDVIFPHLNATKNDIIYAAVSVTFTEY